MYEPDNDIYESGKVFSTMEGENVHIFDCIGNGIGKGGQQRHQKAGFEKATMQELCMKSWNSTSHHLSG